MNHQLWDSYRGKIKTKKGGWKIGEKVDSHGYDLINELMTGYTYMQVIVLNATGKMVSLNLSKWLEAVHISMSWPDPRIWCNRIGALAGTVNVNAVTASSIGNMAADSRAYGSLPLLEGVQLIQSAICALNKGVDINEFVDIELEKHGGKPYLMGFARPIAKGDERVSIMDIMAKELGFTEGEHLTAAYKIDKILFSKFGETINLNGYVSAFMSDQGFNPEEIYRIFTSVTISGVTACYVDTHERLNGAFSPLHVNDILYSGKGPKSLV